MTASNKMPFPRARQIKTGDPSLVLVDELLMTDVKISSFPTAVGRLAGTELVTGLDSGVNTNFTTAQVAALANVYNQTNGTLASVNNATATVHSYSVAANEILSGAVYEYNAKYSVPLISAPSVVGSYQLQYMINATTYTLPIANFTVTSGGNCTIGYIDTLFTFQNGNVLLEYKIYLSNIPGYLNPNYSDTQFATKPFVIGADSFSVASIITSPSTSLTMQINSSTLAGII
jgi:hypothetical protein